MRFMNYNGGQATLRHRADRGFEYTINYTYAKAMTTSSGNYGQPGISGSNEPIRMVITLLQTMVHPGRTFATI